jgi:hypothetical protein
VHTIRFNAKLAAERRLLKTLGEALRLRHSLEPLADRRMRRAQVIRKGLLKQTRPRRSPKA